MERVSRQKIKIAMTGRHGNVAIRGACAYL
jgi:hypothetical protein